MEHRTPARGCELPRAGSCGSSARCGTRSGDDHGVDALLRARAAGQSGLLTRRQALDAGLTPKAIEWRLGSGRWQVVHPGIYQTLPGRDGWESRAVAALLHAGPGSALSHESAAHEWGLIRQAPDTSTVVIPAERRARPVEGVLIRRSRHAAARTDPRAWPHRTQAEHTVLDLSARRGPDRAMALAAKAVGLGLTTTERLRSALGDRHGHRDRSLLLEVFAEVAEGCESPAERRFIRDVERAHGLPRGIAVTVRQGRAPRPRVRVGRRRGGRREARACVVDRRPAGRPTRPLVARRRPRHAAVLVDRPRPERLRTGRRGGAGVACPRLVRTSTVMRIGVHHRRALCAVEHRTPVRGCEHPRRDPADPTRRAPGIRHLLPEGLRRRVSTFDERNPVPWE